MEVFLKYIGSFDVPDTRTPEQVEADRIAEEKLEARRAYHRNKTRQWVERKSAAKAVDKKENQTLTPNITTSQTATTEPLPTPAEMAV